MYTMYVLILFHISINMITVTINSLIYQDSDRINSDDMTCASYPPFTPPSFAPLCPQLASG